VCTVESIANYQRFAGALGETVRNRTLYYAALMGGSRQLFLIVVLASFLIPPVALVVCVGSYCKDRQIYMQERGN
jgi:hypothetical protein